MHESESTVSTPQSWLKLLVGVAILFALFQFLGAILKSDRGQSGILIAFIIIVVTLSIEILFFRGDIGSAIQSIGLGLPCYRGISIALVIASVLLAVFPLYAWITDSELGLQSNLYWQLLGLFAQGGMAEEVLFRGFLFRRIRQGRTFWRASMLAAIPFAVAHLFMFLTLPWQVASAGLLLSIAITFPLAHLFELGGNTIWAPAILHFVVQGAIKVITVSGEREISFALVWMVACLIVPQFAFLVRRSQNRG